MKATNFNKGKLISTLPCGNQCAQTCYAEVSYSDANDYLKKLLTKGYLLSDSLSANGSFFTTLLKDKQLLHLSYTKHDGILRILQDPLTETDGMEAKSEYKRITDYA